MAGRGTRMRPQTNTTPKPLLPIAGKSIVQRLIEELAKSVEEKIDEIAYVIGDFGKETEAHLLDIAEDLGIKGKIYYQLEALGTAHAIYCARESLNGNVIVAFADTLFRTEFKVNSETDGIIWVKKVEDPSQFGVVKLNQENVITDFVEKPNDFVSDLAIIGIYYFKDGSLLRKEIDNLVARKEMVGNEYQLTTVLEKMKNDGLNFYPGEVDDWMDCGNKDATINTNSKILENLKTEDKRNDKANIKNSVIIEPCFVGNNTSIYNSVIGPYVSIEKDCKVEYCIITESIIQERSEIKNVVLKNSFIGKNSDIEEKFDQLNIGDYTRIENG